MAKHSIVEAASTALTCVVFIRSAVAIVENQGLDGIDLDWDYQVNGALRGSSVSLRIGTTSLSCWKKGVWREESE